MKTDTDFLAEIVAREELEKRGWKLVSCPKCSGHGWLMIPVSDMATETQRDLTKVGISTDKRAWKSICYECEGRRCFWVAPETR